MPNYQKPSSEIENKTRMSLSPLLNIVLEILVDAIIQENYITGIMIKIEEIIIFTDNITVHMLLICSCSVMPNSL